jgi:hypothetical protein
MTREWSPVSPNDPIEPKQADSTAASDVAGALTIACVLRSGGLYTADWVAGLQANVARFAPPHRFVCLSDLPVPCRRIPLVTGLRGWWSKIELFRPGLFTGRVLYLDLDVLVTGDLSALCRSAGFFLAWGWNSSVICWDAPDTEVFDRFTVDQVDRLQGDQNWIVQCKPDVEPFPDRLIFSYRMHHLREQGMPENARVIACHGRPKPHEIADEWFRPRWLRDRTGDAAAPR